MQSAEEKRLKLHVGASLFKENFKVVMGLGYSDNGS